MAQATTAGASILRNSPAGGSVSAAVPCARCNQEGGFTFPLKGEGEVHFDCMSVRERRRVYHRCARCGTQFEEASERDEDLLGWITANLGFEDFICPDCQTPAEARARVEAFAAKVAEVKAMTQARGGNYPADLERMAWDDLARVAEAEEQEAKLRRQLGL